MNEPNEFKKPVRKPVNEPEYIKALAEVNLYKDLHDNEDVCGYCCGTGLIAVENPYGLNGDPNKEAGRFPYSHRSLTFCPKCYNGVVHRCKLCGEIMPRDRLKHNCEQQRAIDSAELAAKKAAAFEKAPIAPKEVIDACIFFFSEDYPHNEGYFEDWDEFFEAWYEYHDENDPRPEYVWPTVPVEMKIDAGDIVENATEELYEDAFSSVSAKAMEKLQTFLDDWCKHCGVGATYYENCKYKVRIPWELAR